MLNNGILFTIVPIGIKVLSLFATRDHAGDLATNLGQW